MMYRPDKPEMTPDERAAMDRAKGKQPDPLRFHNPGKYKSEYEANRDAKHRFGIIDKARKRK